MIMAMSHPASTAGIQTAVGWIEKLVGEPLLRASFAYGGELRLLFGYSVV